MWSVIFLVVVLSHHYVIKVVTVSHHVEVSHSQTIIEKPIENVLFLQVADYFSAVYLTLKKIRSKSATKLLKELPKNPAEAFFVLKRRR